MGGAIPPLPLCAFMAWIERTSHYNRYISLSAMQTTILLINIDLQEGPLGAGTGPGE